MPARGRSEPQGAASGRAQRAAPLHRPGGHESRPYELGRPGGV